MSTRSTERTATYGGKWFGPYRRALARLGIGCARRLDRRFELRVPRCSAARYAALTGSAEARLSGTI